MSLWSLRGSVALCVHAIFLLALIPVSESVRISPGSTRRKLSEQSPRRLIVGLRDIDSHIITDKHSRSQEHLSAVRGVASVDKLGTADGKLILLTLSHPLEMESVLHQVSEVDDVAFVEVDRVLQGEQLGYEGSASATALAQALIENKLDDPELALQWGLGAIDAAGGWRASKGSHDVLVCVVDTGIDYTHPDLRDNMWLHGEIPGNGIDDDGNGYVDDVHGYDFHNRDPDPQDDHSHGTHIAGVIGAVAGNSQGIVGVSHKVSLMACKAMNHQLEGYLSDSIRCVQYCHDNGADIMTFSWGSYEFSLGLQSTLDVVEAAGRLIVASAGNSMNDNDLRPYFPACYLHDNILAVASIGTQNVLSPWSSYGKKCVDIAAPGENIYSTMPGQSYGLKWGTSQSVPHVAGVAALLKARYPRIDASGMKLIIMDSAEHQRSLENKCVSEGSLNAYNALRLAEIIATIGFSEYTRTRNESGQD